MTDAAGEVGRPGWQRKHFDRQSRGDDVLLDVRRPAVNAECFKRIEAVGLLDDAMESQGRDLQSPGHLRIHVVFTPGDTVVDPVSDTLPMKGLLLGQVHFLYEEAGQVRHLAHQLSEILRRIDLIGKQYRFLLVDGGLVGTHLDEQIF